MAVSAAAAAALSLSLLLVSCVSPSWSSHGDINEDCKKKLTDTHPHMAAYVGNTYTLKAQHPGGEVYHYEIGVCINLGNSTKHDNCGVIQSGNHSYCLGNIEHAQVAQSKDKVWLELTYTNGDSYNSHCSKAKRTVRLVFLCDPLIHGKGTFDFLEENNEDVLCYYMFNLAGKGVCGLPGDLTVGDIILIMAAALLFLWLLAMAGGLLFKRFMLGAKGWEQIPLLDWYKAFGNLEADGCDFVCRTRSAKLVEYKEPSFGADTDEEDDDKDDNLLPM